MKIKKLIPLILLAFISSCNGQEQEKSKSTTTKYRSYGGELSRPSQSEIKLDSALAINKFDKNNYSR